MRGGSSSGFSLVETIVSVGVLTVGLLGGIAIMTRGINVVTSAPRDLIATQKAAEAIESVFTARDTRLLTWAQIRNVVGQDNDGGVFLDGDRGMRVPGPDGLVNTSDDGPIEYIVTAPGPDGEFETEDDEVERLDAFKRRIEITDVQQNLRQVKVTITYSVGAETKTYELVTYVSNFV
jgi:type II secretory pathway pseudopilin PulG